jgi:predicted MPP superfamily phosphohydrolase
VTILLVMAVSFALGVHAVGIAPRRLTRTMIRCGSPSLRRTHRLLFIADAHLHLGSEGDFARMIVAADWARSMRVDVVLLGGDMIEFDLEAKSIAARLSAIFHGLPVLSVLGNHERLAGMRTLGRGFRRYPNHEARILDALREAGIRSIDDSVATVGELRVVGLAWRGGVGPTGRGRQLIREGSGATVVLTHSPDQIAAIQPNSVTLALCGHTHGGQVRLPLLGTPVTFLRNRLARSYGVMSLNGIRTFVTSGVGQTIPLRIRTSPEVVMVELVPGISGIEFSSQPCRRLRN